LIHTLIKIYRRFRYARYGWFGNYTNWQQAKKGCTGYNALDILQKVKTATLKVQRGEAVYERDALLFDKIEYSWPLLAHLLWIAADNDNNLSVVDFGGSLGSSYFQNRQYLGVVHQLEWKVVEQKEFVTIGQKEIADGQVAFYYTIEDALAAGNSSQVLLLSCVLPYLEEPFVFLTNLLDYDFAYIIIDNTYFNPKQGNRLTIQKVPPLYYEASYPAWFLDMEEVKKALQSKYEVHEEYVNEQFLYLYGEKINYKGLVLRFKNNKFLHKHKV
jgi:putative methyltransferase (TIGR04325 family)